MENPREVRTQVIAPVGLGSGVETGNELQTGHGPSETLPETGVSTSVFRLTTSGGGPTGPITPETTLPSGPWVSSLVDLLCGNVTKR